jgi:hypothetical protein
MAPSGATPAVPAGQAPATPAVPAQGGDRSGAAVEPEARSEPAATAAPRVGAAASSAGTPDALAPPDRAAAPRTTLEAAADRLLADVLGRARAFGGRHGPGLETTLRVADLGVLRLVLEGQPGDVRASLIARDERVAEALMRAVERAGRAVDAPAGIAISVRAETASGGRDGIPWTADAPVDGDGRQQSRNAPSDVRDQGPGSSARAEARRRAGGLDVLA